jgi:2-dehydropantoate 2-reductase
MQVTIFGAGAIGGTIGAFATQAGHDIVLVDIVPEHVKIMNEQGLLITTVDGEQRYPVKAKLANEVTGPLGVVFLCVKGHFTEGAIQQIAPMLAPDGYVVSIQNGLNEEIIARYIGKERTVGCFVHFSADYLEPGVIQYSGPHDFQIGELDGSITPRLSDIKSVLDSVMDTSITTNIWGYLWGKLVYAAMAFAVSTVDATVYEVLSDPRGRRVGLEAAAEAAAVASAQGYKLEMIGNFNPNAFIRKPGWEDEANPVLDTLGKEMQASLKSHMGIWMDLKIKRRKTEVDMQSVPIVEAAKRLGIATPVNEKVIEVVHEIERGERGMGWENLDLLESAIPATSR